MYALARASYTAIFFGGGGEIRLGIRRIRATSRFCSNGTALCLSVATLAVSFCQVESRTRADDKIETTTKKKKKEKEKKKQQTVTYEQTYDDSLSPLCRKLVFSDWPFERRIPTNREETVKIIHRLVCVY